MPLTYAVEKLQDEPIVIVKLLEADELQPSMPTTGADVVAVLDTVSEPVFLILDLGDIKISLDHLISSTHRTVGIDKFLTHPNVREILDVTTNPMLKLAAKGLASKAFGNIKAQIFDTVEDALAYAREQQ
ncbi:MAG: hypothetical protein JXB30_05765 [Anaerolineae bacterium]|nr:hypothetical protein [Anaerolineae bacterium]